MCQPDKKSSTAVSLSASTVALGRFGVLYYTHCFVLHSHRFFHPHQAEACEREAAGANAVL